MTSPADDHAPLAAAAASHTGLRRENNEDRYHCDPERGLFMVIDGVGGQAAGERAAEAALRQIRARLDRETGAPEEQLREAITLANNEVFRLAQSQPDWTGMACVLTVAMVRDGRLVAGHVGDTRLYVFRDGRVQKVTHDHSPIGEREDNGEIGEREAMAHPRRNEVYRDVGYEPHSPTDEHFIEIVDVPFDDESALLLCSDGLSDLVASAAIARIVYDNADDPERVVTRLVEAANSQGGKDNVTTVFAASAGFAKTARRHAGSDREPSPPVDGWKTGNGARAPAVRRRRTPMPKWVGLAAAVAAGCALGAGLGYLALTRINGAIEWALEGYRPETWARTWTVGYDEGAQFSTIADAFARARPGDTIEVGPGEYRAPITLRPGITLVSTKRHEAILRPALGAALGAAVRVPAGADGARLVGFRVAGDAEHPLGVGIRVGECQAEIDDVEISGAIEAGIVLEKGARAVVRGNYVHDSVGPGIAVRVGASPQLLHNAVTANGKVAGSPVAGIELEAGAAPVLFGNIVRGNGDDQIAGLPPERRADVARDNIVGPPAAPPTPPPHPPGRRP
jgi:serine/threonine protein phosphatase PrpC